MKRIRFLFVCILIMTVIPVWSEVFLDVETGAVFNGYNDVGIPGDTGTRFSLTDDFEADPAVFLRLRIGATFGKRHTVSLLYAPLFVKASATIGSDINYNGTNFSAGSALQSDYKFNSYRLTYRYRFVNNKRWRFGAGLSLKIRDAHIRLSGGGVSTEKSNVGFVPLVNFRLEYILSSRFSILFRGDALAAPQGRAEDVLLALRFIASEQMVFRLGYRILEGGADNDEVYNFTALHYAALGTTLRF